jgi:hypothetical protein
MEQLTTLDVEARHKESAARYHASLKSELMEAKAAQEKAEANVMNLIRALGDLKKMADKFTAQVPDLEGKDLDGLNELHTKELSLG